MVRGEQKKIKKAPQEILYFASVIGSRDFGIKRETGVKPVLFP
jgi:hypothetical protein